MSIPVTLVMIDFLCLNYVDGTYVFENDVSHMTGIAATKKCVYGNTNKNLFEYMANAPLLKTRLSRTYMVSGDTPYVTVTISHSRHLGNIVLKTAWGDKYTPRLGFVFRTEYMPKCRLVNNQCFRTWFFNINVTFLHFVMTYVFDMYPFNNYCIGFPEIFKTDMNGTSCEYCGAHYPWSTYFGNNKT